ncbi:hypothetical protein HYU40_00120 [Candidatus Woesearchaeota archaeon]|nr:hypothetical protein [Candidatus Woesearchaeota archaeon]
MADGAYGIWKVFVEVMEPFFEGVLSRKTLEGIAQEAYAGYEGFEPVIEPIMDPKAPITKPDTADYKKRKAGFTKPANVPASTAGNPPGLYLKCWFPP